MESAMQKFQRETREKEQPAQGDNTYVPGAVLPESGIKADSKETVNSVDGAPVNINDPKAQVDPNATKHADGIPGATVDSRGNPVVTADVLKAKARAKEKEMKQLKPVVKTKFVMHSSRPGLAFFMPDGRTRVKFDGNYCGTDDEKVLEYAKQAFPQFVSEVKEVV